MRRENNMTSPLSLPSNPVTCPERISLDNPPEVMVEVKKIILLMFSNLNLISLNRYLRYFKTF